ncbi:MAG: hypothetical protein SCAL_001160 [Candidatus Syntrophoarchaeum caldarius]|uniref:DUF4440 domain-containing protein n=1 Tax=Candidatus Syntropharchaeum caldarium TaxID=1838285 RepID=A0A1F2P9S3_9EURY|nr:MAG: hypothetical protein SCAL_001160 [Candidatus Syntrophoarchaeum caldarius]
MGLTARETLERHASAAIAGDMDTVLADLTPEIAANIGPVAEALAKVNPTSFEIMDEAKEGANYVFTYRYIGKDSDLKLKTVWELQGDAWKIVAAEPL